MPLRATAPLGTAQRDYKPIHSLAKASSACSAQGKIYAQCIFQAQFGEGTMGVEKNCCQQEFVAFKQCVQEKMKRKW